MEQTEQKQEQIAPSGESAAAQNPKDGERKVVEISGSTIFTYFLSAMVAFGIFFVCFLFIFQVVFLQVEIEGYSMLPNLNAAATGVQGDKNTDTVFCFRSNDVTYKDIVVIKAGRTSQNEPIIKRVIATGGQTICLKVRSQDVAAFHYDVYIDGQKLNENYVYEADQKVDSHAATDLEHYAAYNRMLSAFRNNGEYSYTLADDEVFVMGDNRNNSVDSRYFGAIKRNEIIGKVILHIKHGQTIFGAIWNAIF